MKSCTRQRGSSLIESLIALLILSMSALGFAGLQLQGVSRNASALWRSKATQMAYEMADRLRANQGAVASGNFDNVDGGSGGTAIIGGDACGGVGYACNPTQMASLDYQQWQADVGGSLPGGVGVVCKTSTPDIGSPASPACDGAGSTFAIKVFWNEKTETSLFATVVRP